MFPKHTLIRFIASCFFISFLSQAEATIVRMDFAFGAGTVTDQVYIELFDSKAPGTVANFLRYVENNTLNPVERRYENTLIHRSVTGFIVQGGSFTFDSGQPSFTEQLIPIDQYNAIENEFDPSDQERSNIRGTMAMAKTSNPDSATSGWFFNLADNSSSLDDQSNSGGFTVFARVLCDTSPAPDKDCVNMVIVDKFATAGKNSLSIEALTPDLPFNTVPLVNHTAGTPVATDNLIRLAKVEVLNLIQPSALEFGLSPLDIPQIQTITVENQTDFSFTILSVAEDILPPFSILNEDCTTRPSLGPVADPLASRTCSITVSYQPTQAGENNSSFQIKTNHVQLPSLTVWVSGAGAPQEPAISFSPALGPTLQFGSLGPGQAERVFNLTISNLGIDMLTVGPFDPNPFTGTGTENLELSSDCPPLLATGDSCTVFITFSLFSAGTATEAQIEILSNDPDALSSIIQITGETSSDNDGISDAIEAAVSSTGDGNLDGIADNLQDNVTSLPDTFGRYITLETEPGIRLTNVTATESPAPDSTPVLASGTLDFSHGFFSFLLENVPVGGTATVTLYLPEGQTATNYFKFGRLPSDIIAVDPVLGLLALPPHWYSFEYDGDTGAEILGNRIILHFRDGERGDDDLTVDGHITDPGGPAIASASGSSSSGGGGGCSLSTATDNGKSLPVGFVLLLISLFTLRYFRKRCLVR